MNYTSRPRMVHQVGWLRNTLKIKLLSARRGIFFFLVPVLTLVSIIFSSDKKVIAKR